MSCSSFPKSDPNKFPIGVLGCSGPVRSSFDMEQLKKFDRRKCDIPAPSKESYCSSCNSRRSHRSLTFDDPNVPRSYRIRY